MYRLSTYLQLSPPKKPSQSWSRTFLPTRWIRKQQKKILVKQKQESGSRSLKENDKEKLLEYFSPLLSCSQYAEGQLLHVYYQPVNVFLPSPLNCGS